MAHGRRDLHGVARAVDVPVTIARVADTVRIAGGFPLDVTAHGVGGLSRMFGVLRVANTVEVQLALRFVVADPRTAASLATAPPPLAPPSPAALSPATPSPGTRP